MDSGYFFGGMSGVVYGLVAYTWVWKQRDHEVFFPDALLALSIGLLLLGYTDFTQWVGLGRMANSAHLFGLLAGALVAYATLARKKAA